MSKPNLQRSERAALENAENGDEQTVQYSDFYGDGPFADGNLNPNEMRSVASMIAYVSHTQDTAKETVLAIIKTAFGVEDIRSLDQNDYDEVIQFLVDLRVNELMN
jgi:hypothetical protein